MLSSLVMNREITMKKLNILGGIILALAHVTAFAVDNVIEDKIEVEVLENVSYDGCPYSGEVTIQVNFSIVTLDRGRLNLSTSYDSVNFSEIDSVELEGQRGNHLFSFNAGECLQAIQVSVAS